MKLSDQIKPISYLKAHASEIIRKLPEHHKSLIIINNGEEKAVLQDLRAYEQTQETLALLKILALGNKQIQQGYTVPSTDAIKSIRERKNNR